MNSMRALANRTPIARRADCDGNPCTILNRYRCEGCAHEWADAWSCVVDDGCPYCGVTMTPLQSEEIKR